MVANADAKHLSNVRRRVGTHQQYASTLCGELQCRGAGNRGFTHTAFASEKQKARSIFKKLHEVFPVDGSAIAKTCVWK